jgi:hypothetical protein
MTCAIRKKLPLRAKAIREFLQRRGQTRHMAMKLPKYLIILASFTALFNLSAQAATYFVRSGASGNGTSWSSAWGNVSSIGWSSLNAGDTVCIAGGTYSGGITYGKSGSSGSPITLKRATASDATCGSTTAGWNAAYDAQVVMNGGSVTVQGNYVTIDGMVANGISIVNQNGSFVGFQSSGATNGITIRNVEVAGPCPVHTVCHNTGENAALASSSWSGSDWYPQSNWVIQYTYFHGGCQNAQIYGASNWIIEHNVWADSVDDGANGAPCHPNVIYGGSSTNVTFRYNEVTGWSTEGILLIEGTSGWYIYGNVWHDPQTSGYPRVLAANGSSGQSGPVYVYNNTFANIAYATIHTESGTYASGSAAYNNIYWNSQGPGGVPSDYDLSNSSLGESHGQTGTPPFVNAGAKTLAGYHLSGHTNAGMNLGSPYNIDFDGNTRTTWDRGAYEYQSGSQTPPPSAPTGLAAIVQ